MQPCPNCGRTELTPAGNCQTCGLFRGNEGSGAGYAQGYRPPADPYPAAPYTAEPYSAPPHQAYQGQGYQGQAHQGQYAPQQPQYGGGYQDPNAYRGAPARRPSTVPLIVLSVVAVILVIGIVGVVVVRAGSDSDDGGGGGTASGIDKCVVGTWQVTSSKERVDMDGTLTEFTAKGGSVELKADGTGKSDYGNGVTYTGRVSGQSVAITFTGSVSFSYKTSDGSFTFSNPSANGTATVKVNGATTTTIPLDMDTKPARYECSGTSLTQTTDLATVQMSKK